MDLSLSLRRAISLWPNAEAIVDRHKRFTYEQLGRSVSSLAHWFTGFGIKKGDVVAILSPNCHEFLEAYYACAATGIILNPLNFRLAAAELGTILSDSEAKIVLVHTDFSRLIQALAQDYPSFKTIIWFGTGRRPEMAVKSFDLEELLSNAPQLCLPEVELGPDDLAQLYYTSGTTGKSKGVMLTHGNTSANALGAVSELQLTDSDVWAHVAPMFHLVDAWAVFAVTWVGGKHVFVPYFKAPEVLRVFEEERVTLTAMVPTMVNTLLHEKALDKERTFHLRWILTAGSPVAPEQVKKTVSAFNCDYLQFYGMTETSPFLTISKPKASQQNLPVEKLLEIKSKTGRAFIGVQLRVVREDGTDVRRDEKEVGEIIAKGPVVFKGYWNQPEITAETLKNGWIHTGDLAVMDEDGFVNIVDRKKDMIITGGENVYSTEVEYCLYEHPAVLECAVFGAPDPDWGETVMAAIVLRAGYTPTESDLIAFVKERLAGYKSPRAVQFVSELPKTGSGKIFKRGLRETLWRDRERQVN